MKQTLRPHRKQVIKNASVSAYGHGLVADQLLCKEKISGPVPNITSQSDQAVDEQDLYPKTWRPAIRPLHMLIKTCFIQWFLLHAPP